MKPYRSEYILASGCRTHVRHWGDPEARMLLMFHGWGDMSATWQFVVDELKRDWHVIAPDWRGCGKSDNTGRTYYFPDYLADIDAVLDHYSPDRAVPVIGHSMGGNAACLHAGVRPDRVSHLVTLEGLGMPRKLSDQAPDRYADWFRQLRKPSRYRSYASVSEFAARLRRDNPRLTAVQAGFLAQEFGVANAQGGVDIALDPAHKLTNPVLYRVEEAMACWKRITAPVLLVTAEDSREFKDFFPEHSDDFNQRLAAFANIKRVHIQDSGHNMQHDQPAQIARLIEEFIP